MAWTITRGYGNYQGPYDFNASSMVASDPLRRRCPRPLRQSTASGTRTSVAGGNKWVPPWDRQTDTSSKSPDTGGGPGEVLDRLPVAADGAELHLSPSVSPVRGAGCRAYIGGVSRAGRFSGAEAHASRARSCAARVAFATKGNSFRGLARIVGTTVERSRYMDDGIKAKLLRGELPRAAEQVRLIGGGMVGPCAACDTPTTPHNFAVLCQHGGRRFVLHPDCYVAWDEARTEELPDRQEPSE
jgi:hypothetical protein